ncbi:MAG: SDR family oxidoreductase [Patescibacteria group bacterium]|jgi:NADP-dependent 3-hydroxy acid dehydrogenase YdfG
MQSTFLENYDSTVIEGLNIIISGGTTGIGRATAILLSQKGANVLIYGRHEAELNDAQSHLNTGTNNIALIADQSNKSDMDNVFNTVKSQWSGKLDVLINNAGLGAGSVVNATYEEMEYVVKTNLIAYMYMSKKAAEIMDDYGQIVNISSLSAKEKDRNSSLYVATKSGINGFSESLRKQLLNKNIKVSIIEPGNVGTDMGNTTPEEQRQKQAEYLSLKAEDIAYAISICLTLPKRVNIMKLEIKPFKQEV